MSSRETIKAEPLTDLNSSSNELEQLLRLFAAQIQVSLKDAESPYNELAELFATLTQLPVQCTVREDDHQARENIEQLHAKAIVAFQFYDRMCQRLKAVSEGLSDLAFYVEGGAENRISSQKLIKDHGSLYSKQQIEELQSAMQGQAGGENKDNKRLQEDALSQPDIELF